MEVYINVSESNINLGGIKDPILKNKLNKLTKNYLYEVYNEIGLSKTGEIMNLGFSGVLMLEPKEENCCICMVECNNIKDNIVVPDCGCIHKYYHEDCLKRWFRVKKVCPTCNKRCSGKGYRKYNRENPHGKSINKITGWQCCGGTHTKKSTFKSLSSALKHAHTMHNVNVVKGKREGCDIWICNVEGCTNHYIFSDEEALDHLISHHHIKVITEK